MGHNPPTVVPLSQLRSTVFFRWLQHLKLTSDIRHEIPFLPWLEQIKTLEITSGKIPGYSLSLNLPLTQTLQCLKLDVLISSWMLGRTFKALREFHNRGPLFGLVGMSEHEGLQTGLPACTALELMGYPVNEFRFLSCSNVRSLSWSYTIAWTTLDLIALNSIRDFLFNLPCLQTLHIIGLPVSGLDSLIQVVFCDAREQGAWRDIRSVETEVWCGRSSEGLHFFNRAVGQQHVYEKWWKEFTVTKVDRGKVMVRASA